MTDITDVVRRQVQAFNDGDLEAFVSCYHPDAVLLGIRPDAPLEGRAAIRDHYRDRLQMTGLFCELLETAEIGGRWVACHERVDTQSGSEYVMAVFEVADGLITRTSNLRNC